MAILLVVGSEARVQTSFKFLPPPVVRQAPKKLPAINQFNVVKATIFPGFLVVSFLFIFFVLFYAEF